MSADTYRARLRFRLLKKLNIEATEHRLVVSQHEVVLTAPDHTTLIRDSEWLVLNARRFPNEGEARDFGNRLRSALELASVSTRLGIDAGRDIATSSLASAVKLQIATSTGTILRDNVHGVDVFEDDPNVRIFGMSATGTVRANPEPFLPLAVELHGDVATVSDRAKDVVLLLNYALMRPEPVAQIVFAFSAVEMIGQSETWSEDQKRLLEALAGAARDSSIGAEAERLEVAEAIGKSLHRLSLRQGVLRLLDSLELQHLRKTWDALYGERSALVHGLAPRPGTDYADLASRAVSLCGQILLKVIAIEVPAVNQYVDKFYVLPR